jgi:N-acetyl-anhydromuramyl-L-alanine amidase AmpD
MARFSPKYILIHYSSTAKGNAKIFASYHKFVKGWSHLGYHYVLPTDGSIENIIGEYTKGIHSEGFNSNSIAICLVCNDYTKPNIFQIRNALYLCHSLMSRYDISIDNVLGHREAMSQQGKPEHTICPGMNINMDLFRQALKLSRQDYKQFVLKLDGFDIYTLTSA